MSFNSISTKLQHAGDSHKVGNGLVSATENSVTFTTSSATDFPIYSRLGNTSNHLQIESMLSELHGAQDALVTGSGMSALNLILMAFLRPGDHLLVQDVCYGGTFNILKKIFSNWGIQVTFAKIDDWHLQVSPKTKMILFESISNPFCIPQNMSKAIEFAKQHKLISVCDNTFASPMLCTPLSHGADLVFESATKYLNGHSDVVAGMIAASKSFIETLRLQHAYLGTFLAPAQCMQLLRGIRTLELRMDRHCQSAKFFAEALQKSPLVEKIYYGSSDNQIPKIFSRGFGGMVSIQFSKKVDIQKFMTSMNLVTNAPSLGGTESIATLPYYSTNWFMSENEKLKYNINEHLVRFSIGLESPADIVQDVLTTALNSIHQE